MVSRKDRDANVRVCVCVRTYVHVLCSCYVKLFIHWLLDYSYILYHQNECFLPNRCLLFMSLA